MAHLIGLALTWIGALGIIGIGLAYLTKNEKNAAGFGLRTYPSEDARGWWQVKGVRDVTSGIAPIVWIFLAPAQLGWLMLVLAIIPTGDAAIVLSNRGSTTSALAIHGLTSVAMVVAAVLLLV
ncbi:DUF4267 domain-containing protein [Williamsia herbipolensis]|uniref:DUF4267 domain-containing protein n=1 Tax=Williamsia herbipolensis TaxID=1603258 RepID=UPI0005F7FBD7|nr:DUF4267 domain-containing protein [Williamsia herbipolensis]